MCTYTHTHIYLSIYLSTYLSSTYVCLFFVRHGLTMNPSCLLTHPPWSVNNSSVKSIGVHHHFSLIYLFFWGAAGDSTQGFASLHAGQVPDSYFKCLPHFSTWRSNRHLVFNMTSPLITTIAFSWFLCFPLCPLSLAQSFSTQQPKWS
jgi:hypothetical protein